MFIPRNILKVKQVSSSKFENHCDKECNTFKSLTWRKSNYFQTTKRFDLKKENYTFRRNFDKNLVCLRIKIFVSLEKFKTM